MSTARLLSRHQSIRRYNPGMFQSDHDVIQQFVVRKREFRMVLDILRGNIDSPSCQHILLVAPRGMGKSMMLARLVAEIRNNRSFADHLLPVRFMDESHEISSMTDFWLELLSYLAKEIALSDTNLAGRVQKTHAYLAANWNSNLIEYQVRSAVFEIVDSLQKRLVVMVENMQDICERSGEDFGWKLREILQMEPQITLLATANRRFKALDDANEAYFELFRTFYLERLEAQECRCLWQMVSGNSVSEREIRPLEILTSGNPRLLVTVADFAQHRSIRQLIEDLAIIIDNQTEYFCHQLEVLPKTERRIYLAVIDLWKPSTVSEIAMRARVDIRIASIMLGRLIERGSVTASGSKGKRLYVSTERLFSMYYHFRKGGTESTILQNIIRFMSAFYNHDETKDVPYGMIHDFRDQSTSIAESLIRQGGLRRDLGDTETALIRYDEVIDRFNDRKESVIQSEVAGALFSKGVTRGMLGDIEGELTIYNEVIKRFVRHKAPTVQAVVAKTLINKAHAQSRLGNLKGALEAYEGVMQRFGDSGSAELQELLASSLLYAGYTLHQLGEIDAALSTYDKVVNRFGDSGVPEVRVFVATALTYIASGKIQTGCLEVVLNFCERLMREFGSVIDDRSGVTFGWYANCMRMKVLLIQGKVSESLQLFRSIYFAFVPTNESMISDMNELVLSMISKGISEKHIVDILFNDEDRSDCLLPLIAALVERTGEVTRYPPEVTEIAVDLLREINERTRIQDILGN